jgi:hypothetical protein
MPMKFLMRTSKFCLVISACIMVFALPQLTAAQQGTVAAVPPELEKLEEGEAPAVTIRSPEANSRIVEQRERGQVTSVRVQSGTSAYYLKPNTPAGSALPGDVQSSTTRAAQWQVLEFDWNRESEKAGEAAARAATIEPPPAPAAPSKNQ